MRENTEDLYTGEERVVDDNTVEAIKRNTKSASTRIAEFTFDYAVKNNRKLVTGNLDSWKLNLNKNIWGKFSGS